MGGFSRDVSRMKAAGDDRPALLDKLRTDILVGQQSRLEGMNLAGTSLVEGTIPPGAVARKRTVRAACGVRSRDMLYSMKTADLVMRLPGNKYVAYLDGIDGPDLDSTILLEIPSYRDRELPRTIRAALLNAANPDRIHFAVCLQDDETEVLDYLGSSVPHCSVEYMKLSEARGSCYARNLCQGLWDGEDFVLWTDSHMRFAWGWDVALLDQWRRTGNRNAVLSAHSVHHTYDVEKPEGDLSFTADCGDSSRAVCASFFYGRTHTLTEYKGSYVEGADPVPGALIVCHTTFLPARADRAVRFDSDMWFWGDETCMAVRLWTNGYDIYHFGMDPSRHLYSTERADNAKGPTVSGEKTGSSGLKRSEQEFRRTEQLLGVFDYGIDLGEYGLGTVRTLAEYQAWSGIDFRNMRIGMSARVAEYNGRSDDFDWFRNAVNCGVKIDYSNADERTSYVPKAVWEAFEAASGKTGLHPELAAQLAIEALYRKAVLARQEGGSEG